MNVSFCEVFRVDIFPKRNLYQCVFLSLVYLEFRLFSRRVLSLIEALY